MILDWLAQTPALAVALLIVFVPGVAALRLVGMRGLALLAGAPLFSVAATAVIALAFGVVGIPWSPLTWAAAMLVLIACAWGAGRLLGGRLATRPENPVAAARGARWLLPTAIGVGVVFALWRLISYITDPAGVSQTNDAVFHMNAVRFILETADASSLHINEVIGGRSFYPAAWHAIASLIAIATDAGIPIAANMLTLVIGAVIWPLGIAWLTRLATRSGAVAAWAVILSSALHTFPLLMFQWGVLFPNALSVAMIPAGVGLMIALPQWRDDRAGWRRIVRGAALALMAAGALALSQPAALLPWAGLVLIWFTARVILDAPALSPVRRWSIIAGLWIVFIAAWFVLARSTSGSHWPPFRGKLEVFFDVLLNGHMRIPFAVGVSVLMLWGLVTAWRDRRLRWLVFAWLSVSALYVLVAAIGAPIVRVYVLGAWYADPYRISALAPLMAIPLAAVGFDDLLTRVTAFLRRRRGAIADVARRAPVAGVAVLSVFMIVLVAVRPVDMPEYTELTFDDESRYVSSDDSYLTPDERTLLEGLDAYVPESARVIANPSTGSGFGYMLSGVDVYPRTWSAPRTPTWTVISEGLRDAADDPAVCEALHAYGDPQYVLDFGLGERTPGRYELPGMTGYEGQDGFEELASVGDVSLWRITACAR